MAGSYTRRINLYINGKEVKNNIASIKAEMTKLVNEQSRMTRGTIEYIQAGKKIRTLDAIIQQHKEQARSVSKSWNFNNLSQSMNKYFLAVSTFVAGFSGLLYSGKKAITMFAEFDDKVADVQKTTGLTRDRVYAMNEELKQLDTRTAQEELLDLGRIAGKLGINTEKDVEGFIRATDKVVVALKEDLGGEAEEAVRQIGKLVTVFGVRDEFGIEESITKTGSAINELGMASTANEGYIVEFTKRVAGVAPTAKISIQNVMGLAATLDHLGQTSEVSSTAYSQVITGMFKDTPAYAKAARMSVADFTSLLKTDANQAFVKLLEGLHNNGAGMTELINSMGDLDMEGKRAISVIGVLSNNVGLLKDQQAISNREFEKGTSLQQEFNVKNNSAQAILEKKRKVLNNLAIELGQKLMPVLTASTSGFTYFVRAFSTITGFTIKHSGAILTLTASIGGYIIATKLATLWQNRQTQATLTQIIVEKSKAIIFGIGKSATLLYAAATMLLSGNIKKATQAMRIFSSVTKLSPIGLLVGVLTLAAGALLVFAKRSREATIEQKSLENVSSRVSELYDDQSVKIKFLTERIEDENVSNSLRNEAINDLKDIMPGYNAQLTEEGKLINHNTEAIKDYLVMLEMKYRKQAAEEELLELLKKEMEANRELKKAEEEFNKASSNPSGKQLGGNVQYSGMADQDAITGDLRRKKSSLDNAKEKHKETLTALGTMRGEVEKAVQEYQSTLNLDLPVVPGNEDGEDPAAPGGFLPTPDPTGGKSKYSLNSDIMFLKQSLKLKQDYNAGVIKSQEELDAQLRSLEVKFLEERILSGKEKGEELLELQSQLEEKRIEIRKDSQKREDELQGEINKGLSPVEKEKLEFEKRLEELHLFGKNREDMNAQELAALEAMEKEHNQKLSKLDADAMKDEIEHRQETFEYGLAELKLQHTNELNAITTLDQAKQILSKTMSAEELKKVKSLGKAKKLIDQENQKEEEEFTRKHLTELMTILQNVMSSGEWEGLNLSDKVLSEDEKQVLLKRIKELSEALAKFMEGGEVKPGSSDEPKDKGGVDILGFSQKDWDTLLENLKNGNGGIEDLIMGVKALGAVWQAYYDFVAAGEEARLKEYESSVEKQKDTLQSNLDKNIISQETYNDKIADLDEELDRRKAELDYRNAVRSRNVAIMNALVNTASAITAALTVAPPMGIILAAVVGALGGLQVGAIMKTPLPDLPGREAGGFLDVLRSQDGKRFKAKNDPGKRGYVSSPTVITGEKAGSEEYIVSDEGVSNPTVRPILDILEMARMNGNLATINLPAILESTRTYPGRQQGGYISDITSSTSGRNQGAAAHVEESAMLELIRQNTIVIAALNARLKKPIGVALHGRGGLYETMDTDTEIQNNANL